MPYDTLRFPKDSRNRVCDAVDQVMDVALNAVTVALERQAYSWLGHGYDYSELIKWTAPNGDTGICPREYLIFHQENPGEFPLTPAVRITFDVDDRTAATSPDEGGGVTPPVRGEPEGGARGDPPAVRREGRQGTKDTPGTGQG